MNFYQNLITTSLLLIFAGSIITFAIFKFDTSKIRKLGLDKKILMWIPLFGFFFASISLGKIAGFPAILIIIISSIYEFVIRKNQGNSFTSTFFICYLFSISHLGLLKFLPDFQNIFICLVFGTVLSDVGGFILGNILGKHKLPAHINSKKSYEGILGQILGAGLGVFIAGEFIISSNYLILIIPICLGSITGDLLNSYSKRIMGIKNWSELIPGHGGFIDRFSSLAGSTLFTFYFLTFL